MIFLDIEDTTFVAFYTVIRNIVKKGYIHQHLYSTIPLLIDTDTLEEAVEIAKGKCNRYIALDEVRQINMKDRDNILKYYGKEYIAE